MLFNFRLALLRLSKALHGLGSKGGRAGLLAGVAASVEHRDALKPFDFNTIVDVGANRGQFSLFCRDAFPAATIIAFEPLHAPAMVFRSLFSHDRLVELREMALGDHASETAMHITAHDDSSSLLAVGKEQTKSFGTVEVGTSKVSVGRMDEIVTSSELRAPVLLKIDVQGFELQVLQGAGALLSQVDVVFVECSYQELYCGQALAMDIIRLLDRSGFSLAGVYSQSVEANGRALQADFLFCRNAEAR